MNSIKEYDLKKKIAYRDEIIFTLFCIIFSIALGMYLRPHVEVSGETPVVELNY